RGSPLSRFAGEGKGGGMSRAWVWFWILVIGVPLAVFVVWAVNDNAKLFGLSVLNGLTLAALYFLVASGFTLVFGLLRNVNLAHGSRYLFGASVGCGVARRWRVVLSASRRAD